MYIWAWLGFDVQLLETLFNKPDPAAAQNTAQALFTKWNSARHHPSIPSGRCITAACLNAGLPASMQVLDLQMRAIKQPASRSRRTPKVPGIGDDTKAHFSREYMTQVVTEVHQALSTAGMDGPARQAEGLLASSTAAPNQAVLAVSTAGISSSVDIIASELPCLHACENLVWCMSLLVGCNWF